MLVCWVSYIRGGCGCNLGSNLLSLDLFIDKIIINANHNHNHNQP